jgi:hypothetical protein
MKFKLLLIALFLVSGCTTTKVVRYFPDPPKELMQSPQNLSLLEENSDLRDVTITILKNYNKYYAETTKLIALQKWVLEQKYLK